MTVRTEQHASDDFKLLTRAGTKTDRQTDRHLTNSTDKQEGGVLVYT